MNRVINISKEEVGKLKTETAYIVELNGEEIRYSEDFLYKITKAFGFPFKPKNYSGFLDFIRDLTWISENEIIIIIYNYNTFLEKDLFLKQNLKEWFEKTILPFWEEEVIHTVVGGQPKLFNVYLVD